jgi:hypothetical protein
LPSVYGNAWRFKQVFQNLIQNAIKYSDKENAVIEVGVTEKNEHFEFFVKDNGIGINSDYFDKNVKKAMEPAEEKRFGQLAVLKKRKKIFFGVLALAIVVLLIYPTEVMFAIVNVPEPVSTTGGTLLNVAEAPLLYPVPPLVIVHVFIPPFPIIPCISYPVPVPLAAIVNGVPVAYPLPTSVIVVESIPTSLHETKYPTQSAGSGSNVEVNETCPEVDASV